MAALVTVAVTGKVFSLECSYRFGEGAQFPTGEKLRSSLHLLGLDSSTFMVLLQC